MERQQILQTLEAGPRLENVSLLLAKLVDLLELESKISHRRAAGSGQDPASTSCASS